MQWGKDWLISLNTSRTRQVTFHHNLADPEPTTIRMCSYTRKEALKHNPDSKWNSSIADITNDAARIVDSLYRSRKYLTRDTMLYLYNSQLRPSMEYFSPLFWLVQLNPHQPTLKEIKKYACATLWMLN